MEHADVDFKERVKKYFALRTRGCGRLGVSCLFPVFFRPLLLATLLCGLSVFSPLPFSRCVPVFPVFSPPFAPPYLSSRTACSERGCVANPAERPARSPAEAGAEALKLAFESLSQTDKKIFCIDVDPVPSLSVAQVSSAHSHDSIPLNFFFLL